MAELFAFEILGQSFGIESADPELCELVRGNWEQAARRPCSPDQIYRVTREASGGIRLETPEGTITSSPDRCVFLYELEHDIIIRLQTGRPDLYFLHAAALEFAGRVCLLVASSGSGKSTTAWALLHHGFGYLSDELAPIDLTAMQVYAYPHALCVKQTPPPSYPLPGETIETQHTLHVPTHVLPRVAGAGPYSISAVFFLKYCPGADAPGIRPVTPGESSARLYANALNQLAHPNLGLVAASRIARRVPGFMLESAELSATCTLIRDTLTGQSNDPDRLPAMD